MSLRAIGRSKGRFGVSLLGVIFAVGMLVVSLCGKDAVDYLLTNHFYREQSYDYLIRFASPVKEHELFNISHIDGVIKTEPIFEIPVRFHYKGTSEEGILLGLSPDVTLKKLVDTSGQPLQLPQEGILINERAASKLGVKVSDKVTVEILLGYGPSHHADIKIVGVNRQLIGRSSYISLAQANRILQEAHLVSGAMLKVDPGKAVSGGRKTK